MIVNISEGSGLTDEGLKNTIVISHSIFSYDYESTNDITIDDITIEKISSRISMI